MDEHDIRISINRIHGVDMMDIDEVINLLNQIPYMILHGGYGPISAVQAIVSKLEELKESGGYD